MRIVIHIYWYPLQANIAKAVVSADTLSPGGIQARLEELQKELIEKITIFADRFTVKFKSGLAIDIEA